MSSVLNGGGDNYQTSSKNNQTSSKNNEISDGFKTCKMLKSLHKIWNQSLMAHIMAHFLKLSLVSFPKYLA